MRPGAEDRYDQACVEGVPFRCFSMMAAQGLNTGRIGSVVQRTDTIVGRWFCFEHYCDVWSRRNDLALFAPDAEQYDDDEGKYECHVNSLG